MTNSAIVVGATGLVGSSLVTELEAANHVDKIVSITRRPVQYSSAKVINQVIDFEHLDDFKELFTGQILFSCLGTTLKQAGSIEAQRRIDLEYQYKVARLASEQGIERYFLVSSSGANANSFSPYLRMKGELEDRVKSLEFESTTIVQPSLLLGKRPEVRLGEALGAKLLPIVCRMPGMKRYRPIHGYQVARRMVSLSKTIGPGFLTLKLDEVFP